MIFNSANMDHKYIPLSDSLSDVLNTYKWGEGLSDWLVF